ncbi:hypothetical protein ACLMJK_004633 [Lecanora helva]
MPTKRTDQTLEDVMLEWGRQKRKESLEFDDRNHNGQNSLMTPPSENKRGRGRPAKTNTMSNRGSPESTLSELTPDGRKRKYDDSDRLSAARTLEDLRRTTRKRRETEKSRLSRNGQQTPVSEGSAPDTDAAHDHKTMTSDSEKENFDLVKDHYPNIGSTNASLDHAASQQVETMTDRNETTDVHTPIPRSTSKTPLTHGLPAMTNSQLPGESREDIYECAENLLDQVESADFLANGHAQNSKGLEIHNEHISISTGDSTIDDFDREEAVIPNTTREQTDFNFLAKWRKDCISDREAIEPSLQRYVDRFRDLDRFHSQCEQEQIAASKAKDIAQQAHAEHTIRNDDAQQAIKSAKDCVEDLKRRSQSTFPGAQACYSGLAEAARQHLRSCEEKSEEAKRSVDSLEEELKALDKQVKDSQAKLAEAADLHASYANTRQGIDLLMLEG